MKTQTHDRNTRRLLIAVALFGVALTATASITFDGYLDKPSPYASGGGTIDPPDNDPPDPPIGNNPT